MAKLERESGLGGREREREPSYYGSRWSLAAAKVWLREAWPPLNMLGR